MNLRNVGGWTLLLNALAILVVIISSHAMPAAGKLPVVIGEIASLLFIVGVWAFGSIYPQLKRLGGVGLWCLGLAAGVALIVRALILIGTDVPDSLPFVSALLGLIGSLALGVALLRTRMAHPAIVWFLMMSGVLNLAGGLFPSGTGATIMSLVADLAQATAVAGMGWTMLRNDAAHLSLNRI